MTDKTFAISEPISLGPQGFVYGSGFGEFVDKLSQCGSDFTINRGASYVIPADGMRLFLDKIVLPLKIGRAGEEQSFLMNETFLIQLLNMFGFTPKTIDTMPHDLIVEAVNRKMSADITRHLKVRVVGRVAVSIVNPRYTYIHPYDTINHLERGTNGQLVREWRLMMGWADCFGTMRTIWYFPSLGMLTPSGTMAYGAVELILNNYMACYPTVTPCVFTGTSIAVLKRLSSKVMPTGTHEQANAAIIAKFRRAIIDVEKYLHALPVMASVKCSPSEAELLTNVFNVVGVTVKPESSWYDIFTTVCPKTQPFSTNLIRVREMQMTFGDMLEGAYNESRKAKV